LVRFVVFVIYFNESPTKHLISFTDNRYRLNPKKEDDTLRIGIAGAQHFHMFDLLQGLSSYPGLELAGACDVDPIFRERLINDYRLTCFDSLEQLIRDGQPQVVGCFDILGRRADTIIRCLEQGISVLSDKPPVTTFGQLERLQKIVDRTESENGPVFSVIFSERYNPPVYTLKNLIDSGTIGQLVNFTSFRPHKLKKAERPAWMFNRDSYGGIIVDLAVHDLDVFNWLTGSPPVEVTAYHSNATCPEFPEFEDNGQILFRSESGQTGFVKVEWLAPEAHPTHGDCRYFVTGTLGSVEVYTGGDLSDRQGKIILCTHRQKPEPVPLIKPETGLYEDFFNLVSGQERRPGSPMITIPEMMAVLRVTLTARESADCNQKLTIKWSQTKES
jgi:predicted dehydrogenase